MGGLTQTPAPGTALLFCAGDVPRFTLQVSPPRPGAAFLRTNLGYIERGRDEIIAHAEETRPFLAADWHDIPMRATGPGTYEIRVPLLQPGWFAAKACFIPDEETDTPEWPAGTNTTLKVAAAETACANTLYTAFVRQFRDTPAGDPGALTRAETELDRAGYAAIPPSGTFRNLSAKLDFIIGTLGFRIIQLLPIHPVPTTYARMGRFGSPFASLDYLAVDPALAEFDKRRTPLEQFCDLADAVHARGARLLLDLPANHTGWASTLQNHHPEWFSRKADGTFKSPGAWGTVWEDLVELDYHDPRLATYMAEVFLFWCRQGADGFRCDAGYMIPPEIWRHIVARVRRSYPATLFLLEGLGGKIEVTDELLTRANLDWAYSEIFQEEDRRALENYLPEAIARSQRVGPLIHLAETHDNNRLAARGAAHARMRTALAALLSQCGAFGITNGLEWLATVKIDVHGATPLNWGAAENQVDAIALLNRILARHHAFGFGTTVRLITRGDSNTLVARRNTPSGGSLLVVANLDTATPQTASWEGADFAHGQSWDLLTGQPAPLRFTGNLVQTDLAPGEVRCLTPDYNDLTLVQKADVINFAEPDAIRLRRRNLMALLARNHITGDFSLPPQLDAETLGEALAADPVAFCAACVGGEAAPEQERLTNTRRHYRVKDPPAPLPRVVNWNWPRDLRRDVMLPPGFMLLVRAPSPFRAEIAHNRDIVCSATSIVLIDGSHATFLMPAPGSAHDHAFTRYLTLHLTHFAPEGAEHAEARLLSLGRGEEAKVNLRISAAQVSDGNDHMLLTNGRGTMSQIRAAWGTIRSQYDALLAVNPSLDFPENRRIFLTRCRVWVRYRGYSCALEAACTEWVEADPGGTRAIWRFATPVGMGRRVTIDITASLTRGRNRLSLRFRRIPAATGYRDALDDSEAVAIIIRPDIESRDFHTKTLAFTGPEHAFPAAIETADDSFRFHPGPQEDYRIAAPGGSFRREPEWLYGIAHPEDGERGLGAQSDLFSPGWFSISLRGGDTAEMIAATTEDFAAADESISNPEFLIPNSRHASAIVEHPAAMPIREALIRALDTFIVKRGNLRTIIAGYPWFLDWGRDTLIALRGLAAAGRAAEALEILRAFGDLERDGTLPNMLRGGDHANRSTSDAPLWFMVVAGDLMDHLGVEAVRDASCGGRTLHQVVESIIRHTLEGTPNGIGVDSASGLVFSPAHFTWMDTNHPAATPREGYPVDIQALWIAGLAMLRTRLGDQRYAEIETRARESLLHFFEHPGGWLADVLRAAPGQPAATGVPEDALRPNQLLAVTLGAIPPRSPTAAAVVRACEQLLIPGAIRSLADRPVTVPQPVRGTNGQLNDPFNPYWGHYCGDEDTRRKPAYHNGTAWVWPFPLYGEALLQIHGEAAKPAVLALLASVKPLMETGCIGNLPEIADGDTPHVQRGCGAQAWSIAEILRVWQLCQPELKKRKSKYD